MGKKTYSHVPKGFFYPAKLKKAIQEFYLANRLKGCPTCQRHKPRL